MQNKTTITFNGLETEVSHYSDSELSPFEIIDSVVILGSVFPLCDLSEIAIDKIRSLVEEARR
jgi:hypothetical protein